MDASGVFVKTFWGTSVRYTTPDPRTVVRVPETRAAARCGTRVSSAFRPAYTRGVSGRDDFLCYTDGSCKAGDGAPGGWGFHVRPPQGPPIEGYGRAKGTLAKVMEMRAVAEALEVLPDGASAVVFSDNQSLVENLARKLPVWRANGFTKVDPLLLESVRRIDASLQRGIDARFAWIRAHNGNAGNERADALAAQGAREAKAELEAGRKARHR